MNFSLKQQLKTHSVAIISLLTAIAGFTYNSLQTKWIEENATRRDATFQTLIALGELQEIVNYAHYETDRENGNPISGWSRVLLVKDLSILVHDDPNTMDFLFETWQEHFATLDEPASEKAISDAIAQARNSCLLVLANL